jgi:hypothetical protein
MNIIDKASPARLSHTATLVGPYLFIIGGHDGHEYEDEVMLLNLGKSILNGQQAVKLLTLMALDSYLSVRTSADERRPPLPSRLQYRHAL